MAHKQTAAQLENLKKKPFKSDQSREEAAKNGRKGGIASGKAKREKKSLNQLAKLVAESPITDNNARKQIESIGITDADLTNNAMVVAGLLQAAAGGNVGAVEKWESMLKDAEAEGGSSAHERALAVMRSNFWDNVSSNFGAISVYAIKHRFTHYQTSGGRGSFKSSWVSLIVVRLVMEHPDTHALVMRKIGNTIADSVFAQYQWAIEKLGVADYWRVRKSPPSLTYLPTGQKILFRGTDDPLKIKSIKIPSGYIAFTHFEELDQFAGRAEIRNILQSTMRGGPEFWNFESFNPPRSRDNWANRDSAEERPDRVQHKSTYLDVDNPEWLGDQFLAEAEHLKETDPKSYEHEYLGHAVGTGGSVFDNLELCEITDDEVCRFDHIYQGVDWGWFPDPYAFIRLHYDRARETIYLLDERYENRLTNEETAKWILAHKYNDVFTTCDSAEPKSVADYRALGVNAKEAVKGPGSVEYGMKWLQGRKIVIDRRRTPHAFQEFVNYEYEKNKDDEWISGYPDANNHLIDATRYALERVFRRFGSNA